MQVFDLSKHAPDKVLRQLWDNFTDGGTSDADHLRTSLRILTAGGDGTVAWVLQVCRSVLIFAFCVPEPFTFVLFVFYSSTAGIACSNQLHESRSPGK